MTYYGLSGPRTLVSKLQISVDVSSLGFPYRLTVAVLLNIAYARDLSKTKP